MEGRGLDSRRVVRLLLRDKFIMDHSFDKSAFIGIELPAWRGEGRVGGVNDGDVI